MKKAAKRQPKVRTKNMLNIRIITNEESAVCGGGSDHPVVAAALMNGPKTIDFGKLFNSIHEEIIVPIFSSSSSQTDDSWINRRTTHRASLVLKKLIFCAAQLGMGNERASECE